jgi:3-oxoacyl-[acyl-carrier protein] reductase
MDLGLNHRVAVVFAASRGLGKATALALAAEGCRLAIASRDPDRIAAAAREIREQHDVPVLSMAVDVTRPENVLRFAGEVEREYGEVDVLVNNSGGPPPGTFDTLAPEQFQQATELLLLNVVRATKAFLPLIRKTGRGGRILTITSVAVREVIPNLMLSNSLRAAVTGWSKTLARELAPENILVNCVAPGIILTERITELIAANAQKTGQSPEATQKGMLAKIPLGRFGRPEEFGAVMAFLASARASFVSGITVYVDGAMMSTVV